MSRLHSQNVSLRIGQLGSRIDELSIQENKKSGIDGLTGIQLLHLHLAIHQSFLLSFPSLSFHLLVSPGIYLFQALSGRMVEDLSGNYRNMLDWYGITWAAA